MLPAGAASGNPGAGLPPAPTGIPRSWRLPGAAVTLPGGPWVQMAQDVDLRGNRLCARLRRDVGGPWDSDCTLVQEGQRFQNVGGKFRVENSLDFPGGTWMFSARDSRLEGELFYAQLRRKDLTWRDAHVVVWDGSYFENDDGAFRLLMQSCEQLACIHGYVLRANATYRYCEFLACEPVRDLDTCCEPAMPCSNITTCGYKQIPDPFGYCLATTCDEERDSPHCCVPSAPCAGISRCLDGYVLKDDAHDINCPRILCDATLDRDTCCTPAMPCTNLTSRSCPHGKYFNALWWCAGVTCEDARDLEDVCCQEAESCSNTTLELCGRGFLAKPNASGPFCEGASCAVERDRSSCCDAAGPCSGISCAFGLIALPNTFCAGVLCDPATDTGACCRPKAPCTNLTGRACPFGHFFNTTDFCASVACVEAVDRDHCCQVAAPCTTFVCPVGSEIKQQVSTLFCNGQLCDLQRDIGICCDVAAPCGTMACPHGFTPTENASSTYCLGPFCVLSRDRDICCDVAAACDLHYACPHGYTPRSDTYCDGAVCEAARDRDFCCDPAMPCTAVTCPRNYVITPDTYCLGAVCIDSRDLDWCCEPGVPISYVKFTPLQLRSVTSDDNDLPVCQLAELTLYWHGARVSTDDVTAFAINGTNPELEQPIKAVDGIAITKWLDYQSAPFVVHFPTVMEMNSYTLMTANDAPRRDPISWRLEGSFDGSLYVLLHEITDRTEGTDKIPLERLTETEKFPIAIPCFAPRADIITNGAAVACEEGELLASGTLCTAVCAPGFAPVPDVLNCTQGELTPLTFLCT